MIAQPQPREPRQWVEYVREDHCLSLFGAKGQPFADINFVYCPLHEVDQCVWIWTTYKLSSIRSKAFNMNKSIVKHVQQFFKGQIPYQRAKYPPWRVPFLIL